MTKPELFALLMAAFAIIQIIALRATVNALESRHDSRLKVLENRNREQAGKAGQVPQQPMQPQVEPPKAGTVAAKAAKPVVFLGHVPHRAIELDNGCLEWEGKI